MTQSDDTNSRKMQQRQKQISSSNSRLKTFGKVILGVGLLTAGIAFPPLGATLFIGVAMYGVYKLYSNGNSRFNNYNRFSEEHNTQSDVKPDSSQQLQQQRGNLPLHTQSIQSHSNIRDGKHNRSPIRTTDPVRPMVASFTDDGGKKNPSFRRIQNASSVDRRTPR